MRKVCPTPLTLLEIALCFAKPTSRALTNDEKKAAESAFTGGPFNPEWSESARKVYDGILNVTGKASPALLSEQELEPVEVLA
jgi:hypothetical protein